MRLTPTGSHNKAWGRRGNGAPQVGHPKTARTPTGFHTRCGVSTRALWNPVGVRIHLVPFPGVRRHAATPGYVVKPVPG